MKLRYLPALMSLTLLHQVAMAEEAAGTTAPSAMTTPAQQDLMQFHQKRERLHEEFVQKMRETQDPQQRQQMMRAHTQEMQQNMQEMRQMMMQEHMSNSNMSAPMMMPQDMQAMQEMPVQDGESAEMPMMPYGYAPMPYAPYPPMPYPYGRPYYGYGMGHAPMYDRGSMPAEHPMCAKHGMKQDGQKMGMKMEMQAHRQKMEARLEKIEGMLKQLIDAQAAPAAAAK